MNASHDLTDRLKAEALRLGFDQVGIAPAVAPPGHAQFLDWLDTGCAAGMDYLPRHAEVRAHPDRLLDGVRSVVMVSLVYGRPEPATAKTTNRQGKIARVCAGGRLSRGPLASARRADEVAGGYLSRRARPGGG